jgi:hypothetical protein
MTIQEAAALIKEGKFTEKELLEYYQIKTLDGLEPALEIKFDKESYNESFISSSFEFIFETRKSLKYNPLEEKYRFYSMVLPGLFGIYAEEVQMLAIILGLFQTVMLLEKILKEKDSVKYYKELYETYIKTELSIEKTVMVSLRDLEKTITDFLSKNDTEKLKTMLKDIVAKVEEIKP